MVVDSNSVTSYSFLPASCFASTIFVHVSAFTPKAISTATPRSSLLRLGGIVIAISVVGFVTVTASPTTSPSVRR